MDDLISRQATYLALVEKGQASKRYKLGETWELNGEEIREVLDALPSTQPEISCSEFPNNSDLISRQAAIDAVGSMLRRKFGIGGDLAEITLAGLPSAQPEIIRCKDCIYYDPPHVENNGVRYEYDEMPADAFDALGTGLVNAEYGINIGGRCCVDYYCKNYSDDKRVFVREDNYCGRAERRTDERTD